MREVLIVGVGGAAGSILRFLVARNVAKGLAGHGHFPTGTLVVNVAGCLVIGVLGGLVEKADAIGHEVRLLLFVGLMGGFTTFSAFGLETFQLLRRAEFFMAGVYVGLSVLAGLLAVGLGYVVGIQAGLSWRNCIMR